MNKLPEDIQDDLQLGELLKKEAYPATENRWFTRRVLNRLPASHHRNWFITAVYIVVAIVCVISWHTMLTSLSGTVTVRDVLYMVIMAVVTLYAILSAVATMVKSE